MTAPFAAVAGFGLALIVIGAWQCATSRRRHNQATSQALALTQPPAREVRATGSQLPAPGHQHGGVTSKIILFRCGCCNVLDHRGALTEVIPCWGPTDLDDELKGLLS